MKTSLFVVLNAALAALLAVLAVEGYVTPVFHDITWMTHGVGVLGAMGVALSAYWYLWGNADDRVSQVHWLSFIEKTLVVLGLLGTVIGFRIAMGGISPDMDTNASSIAPMIRDLGIGIGLGQSATIVGLCSAIWIAINAQFIASGD